MATTSRLSRVTVNVRPTARAYIFDLPSFQSFFFAQKTLGKGTDGADIAYDRHPDIIFMARFCIMFVLSPDDKNTQVGRKVIQRRSFLSSSFNTPTAAQGLSTDKVVTNPITGYPKKDTNCWVLPPTVGQ